METLLLLIPGLLILAAEPVREIVGENDVLLDSQAIAMIAGLVIPLLVGLVTKINASGGLRAVLNAFFSAVAGAIAVIGTDLERAELRTFVVAIVSTWIVSVATYYGVWKPTGVAGSVIDATGRFGLSSPPVVQTDDKGVEDAGNPYSDPHA